MDFAIPKLCVENSLQCIIIKQLQIEVSEQITNLPLCGCTRLPRPVKGKLLKPAPI